MVRVQSGSNRSFSILRWTITVSAQLHRTAVGFAHRRAGICVGAVPAVQRAPPAHAPQRAPPRSQRVAAWRVAASLPYGALPAVRAARRASSRPPPSWRPPAPRESCAARAARARRPSSRPHRTRTSRAQRARAARARRPSSRPHRAGGHPCKTPPCWFRPAGAGRKKRDKQTDTHFTRFLVLKGLGSD